MAQQNLLPQLTLKQLYEVLKTTQNSAVVAEGRKRLDPGASLILREDGDEEFIPKLLLLISEVLVLKGDLWTKEIPKNLRTQIQNGLETIELISNLSTDHSNVDNVFLLRLLEFTNSRDPWMTPTSFEIAERLCHIFESQITSEGFLINQILKETIRPLFSKSRPSTITPSARKAINPDRRGPNEPSDIDPATKPWKFEFPGTITVFGWVVEHIDTTLLTQNWPLIIPPLLTLLDDPTPALRSRAIYLLSTLLKITPPSLLHQTGLGEVFTDAVFPTLLYLPSLTPTADSLMLLKPAYAVLYELSDLIYSPQHSSASDTKSRLGNELEKTTDTNKKLEREKQKFNDRIFRDGILQGYLYAHENIEILELLIGELGIVVKNMGIYSVKHLKQIIPLLLPSLTDPFLPSTPIGSSLLKTTIQTTQLLIQNTWPRISEPMHRNPLVNALCISWIHTLDSLAENGKVKTKLLEIKKELAVAGTLLAKAFEAMNPGVDLKSELKPVLDVGGRRFEELFFGGKVS